MQEAGAFARSASHRSKVSTTVLTLFRSRSTKIRSRGG